MKDRALFWLIYALTIISVVMASVNVLLLDERVKMIDKCDKLTLDVKMYKTEYDALLTRAAKLEQTINKLNRGEKINEN